MEILGGLLILALVCAFCLALAAAFGYETAALPLPVLSGSVMVLLAAGYAGFLHQGLWCLYGVLAGATALLGWRAERERLLHAAQSAGLWFFAGAGAFFWVLFAVYRPMFIQWDEFTFWGVAAKILKDQNMLYCAAPGNLAARAGMPGLALLSYFFQGCSDRFGEWQCLAAYNIFFMACLAAACALPKKRWNLALLTAACGVLLPFFFTAYEPGAVSSVYRNAMADVPLALQFGGTLCLWCSVSGRRSGLLLTGLALAMLTATKDMGFAYALIAVFVIFCAELAAGVPKEGAAKWLGLPLGKAAVLCLPVLAVFLSWSRYYGAVTSAAKESVGSAGLSYGALLAGGLKQLLGIGRTEYFAALMERMGEAFFTRPVCLLGSGAAALAVITLTAVLAFWCSGRGPARRAVAAAYAALAFCFAAFYAFHLILYCYNFAETEALMLKDYGRYIGPYYQGWMLAMLCLLARAAAGAPAYPESEAQCTPRRCFAGLPVWPAELRRCLGTLALACAALCFAGVFAWRRPTAGFWQDAGSLYGARRAVQARAAAANEHLTWNDDVLIISQGDDSTRWYYYNYELNANVLGWFGGDSVESRWESEFANLVESLNWQLYPQQAVCTPAMLVDYVRQTECEYLLLDRADGYLEREFSPLFEGGITADMDAVLYKVVDDGETLRFVPASESGAAA